VLTKKSYWGTLRPGTASYRVFAKQMENLPLACGARWQKGKTAPDAPQVRVASAGGPAR